MGGLQAAIASGEPVPMVRLDPQLVDVVAPLGIAYAQIVSANILGLLLGRTYKWRWASGGAGILLVGDTLPAVTLTSVSLAPVIRAGVLELEVSGPPAARRFEVPVTIRHA